MATSVLSERKVFADRIGRIEVSATMAVAGVWRTRLSGVLNGRPGGLA